jgi:hypothetical protein
LAKKYRKSGKALQVSHPFVAAKLERVLVLLQLLGGQQRVELTRSAIEAIE